MKRLVLIIGMVIVLVGSVMGGLALHASAAPPQTLKAWGSTAPGTVTITGTNWIPMLPVDLWMDIPYDTGHHVAVAAPGSNGVFMATFMVGPTWVGDHHIYALQHNLPNPSLIGFATFTITNTSQVEDRVVKFEEISGSANRNSLSGYDFGYTTVRHVSVTLCTFNMGGTDNVEVKIHFAASNDLAESEHLATITTNGVNTYEFDTDGLDIIPNFSTANGGVYYQVTTIASGLVP